MEIPGNLEMIKDDDESNDILESDVHMQGMMPSKNDIKNIFIKNGFKESLQKNGAIDLDEEFYNSGFLIMSLLLNRISHALNKNNWS